MDVAGQISLIQKKMGDYQTDTATLILQTLNATYLQYSEAHPGKVLTRTSSFNTVAGLRDTPTSTDAGAIIRAWHETGEDGADGEGTISVWATDRLVRQYPQFHIDTGYPRALAPIGFDTSGYLLVNFDRLPDAVYAIGFHHRLKITPISDTAEEMSVWADAQQEIALRAALVMLPGDSEAFRNISSLLGLNAMERDAAAVAGPNDQNEWQMDAVTQARKDPFYSRYARG